MANSMNVTTKPHLFDQLKQKEKQRLAPEVSNLLDTHRFWYVKDNKTDETHYLFDTESQLLYVCDDDHNDPLELADLLREKINKKRFWHLNSPDFVAQIDTSTKILYTTFNSNYSIGSAKEKLGKNDFAGAIFSGWILPTRDMIVNYANISGNPWRSGRDCRLYDKDFWLCEGGRVDFDSCSPSLQSSGEGWLLAVNKKFQNISWEDFFIEIAKNQLNLWSYIEKEGLNPNFKESKDLTGKTPEQIIDYLYKNNYYLHHLEEDVFIAPQSVMQMLKEMDYRSVRLPMLQDSQFTDINQGIWEFWGMDAGVLKANGVNARNPALDVKKYTVGIDFGTSSTVVAIDRNGHHELLRIGLKDFFATTEAKHYENPTVLEFVDYPEFLKVWQSQIYRPDTSWSEHIRCAHEAQHNFRNNDSNPEVVSSVLIKMKQWALRNQTQKQKLTDQVNRHEFELSALEQRNPVSGQMFTLNDINKNFDPIELYAWFLGMTINWRGRNEIFTKYYMTFPVDYQKETKEKILASFRRGLMRAMPASLVSQEIFRREFLLEELATEPAAYAASALDSLGIKPSKAGTAYGIFDFGGGTTDFDYGYYRYATEEEEAQGYEKILEHVDAQGDKYLGGENLLENLAYLVFQDNLDICAKEKIAFDQPLGSDPFPGYEAFLTRTQLARTNTVMLMQKLRPFWETGVYENNTGIETIEFLNNNGEAVKVDFKISVEMLDAYLTDRIEEGISNFFIGAKAAFTEGMPDKLYFLLAGNSSRSKWVKEFFSFDKNSKNNAEHKSRLEKVLRNIFKNQKISQIIVKSTPPMDDKDPFKPTAKTGVALGLLKLAPGGQIGVVSKSLKANHGEASFGFFVGRLKQGNLNVILARGHEYHQWHELAPINRNVVNLYYTQAPRALLGNMEEDDAELNKVRIDFAGKTDGHKAFVRATKPNEVEICSAPDLKSINKSPDNLQTLTLG